MTAHTTPTHQARCREVRLLQRLMDNRPRRVHHREQQTPCEALFCRHKEDFPTGMLPFAAHPLFQAAGTRARRRVLSAAWLAYNRKAVDMEERVVGPACMVLARGEVPVREPHLVKDVVRQVFIDEGAHLYTLQRVNQLTRGERRLQDLRLPAAALPQRLEVRVADEPDAVRRGLLRVAGAVIAEVSITDYLGALRSSPDLQPLNHAVTEWHRKDEMAHAGIFSGLCALVYRRLDAAHQRFFADALLWARHWFFHPEWDAWREILAQLRFPHGSRIIAECRAAARPDPEAHSLALAKLFRRLAA